MFMFFKRTDGSYLKFKTYLKFKKFKEFKKFLFKN